MYIKCNDTRNQEYNEQFYLFIFSIYLFIYLFLTLFLYRLAISNSSTSVQSDHFMVKQNQQIFYMQGRNIYFYIFFIMGQLHVLFLFIYLFIYFVVVVVVVVVVDRAAKSKVVGMLLFMHSQILDK